MGLSNAQILARRLGGHAKAAKAKTPEARTRLTEAARKAGPGKIEHWLTKVDPDGALPETERLNAALKAKYEYYRDMGRRSAAARKAARGEDEAAG